jgi:hypothetical protein
VRTILVMDKVVSSLEIHGNFTLNFVICSVPLHKLCNSDINRRFRPESRVPLEVLYIRIGNGNITRLQREQVFNHLGRFSHLDRRRSVDTSRHDRSVGGCHSIEGRFVFARNDLVIRSSVCSRSPGLILSGE